MAINDDDNVLLMETTKGTVTIVLRPDLAPNHTARIKKLVREKFYNGVLFHRVISGFIAQTGCPKGDGTGGSGAKLKSEFSSEPHIRGTVSMARTSDSDSADSQFFVCLDKAPYLNQQYTVLGAVTNGMDVIDSLKKGDGKNGLVDEPDRIISLCIASDVNTK